MEKSADLERLLQSADPQLLAGKAIVITGAGGGIGRVCAIVAAACGARVVVNDVRADAATAVAREIDPSGKIAVANHDPVQQWDGAKSLIDTCVNYFGSLDGLVNSAGLAHNALPWEEPEADIRALIDVNVMGVIFCGRHAMPIMMKQRSGSIINMASGNAFGTPNSATYSASKAAVASATFSWAFDLMPYGVRANALSPYATTHIKSYWQDVGKQLGYTGVRESTAKEIAGASSPSKPAPENMVPLMTYLLSDRSRHITSQFIQLHGKRMTLIQRPVEQINAGPHVDAETWDLDLVAKAFAEDYADKLQPVVDYMMRYPKPSWPWESSEGARNG
jgi:NAD(P)-dependent dehydrogenase (short-subunit alcohol dehydrogenase family)